MDYTPSRPREKVLVLVHHNERGPYIEAYAEKHIDIKIRDVPYVGTGASGEILAEDFTEAALPWVYRDLYWPGKLRAHSVIRPLRPSELADTREHRRLLRGLGGVLSAPSPKPKRGRPVAAVAIPPTNGGKAWW